VQSSLCKRSTLSALAIAAELIKQYLSMTVKDFHFSGWRSWPTGSGHAETCNFAGFSQELPVLSEVVGRAS
jgi:hypothetical protein